MSISNHGLIIARHNEVLETVDGKGLTVSLVASGDGLDVIHHTLEQGARWSITPSANWTGFEFVYVLRGDLVYKSPMGDVHLCTGDKVSARSIGEHAYFMAEVETEFLYISSQPTFHYYSGVVSKLTDLAVEVEHKDGYTADHCQRIMQMAMRLGESMHLSSTEMHILNHASFFHDVGKLRIDESILNKPGKLTNEEWVVMKRHPIFGREILEETGLPYLQAAGTIVEQHHERYDGEGYPYGISGDNISISAAIISVVDTFDAITSSRVYRAGRSREIAFEEILKYRGAMYHPEVVDVFLSMKECW